MRFYCEMCDKTINRRSRNRHNKTNRHDFMKNDVTNIYNYNATVLDDIEDIFHEKIINHNNNIDEFETKVICKINDDIEIKFYKSQLDLHALMFPFSVKDTLYVHVAGKTIYGDIWEVLSAAYIINPVADILIKILSIEFISRYKNLTFRYQLLQPRTILESKMIK